MSSRITPPGDPTSRTRVTPALAQVIRVAQAASSSSATRPAGPEPTAGSAWASTQARQDQPARQEVGTGDRPVMIDPDSSIHHDAISSPKGSSTPRTAQAVMLSR